MLTLLLLANGRGLCINGCCGLAALAEAIMQTRKTITADACKTKTKNGKKIIVEFFL
jgi:hypothetical protein